MAKAVTTSTNSGKGAKKTSTMAAATALHPDERQRMIQDAAYHVAERDGFQQGREHDYWVQAEKQIDDWLTTGQSSKTH